MEPKNIKTLITPEKAHRDEVILQILFPILIVILVCLGVFIFSIVTTFTDFSTAEKWAKISTIFLIIPAIFIGIMLLALMILSTILVFRLNKYLPGPIRKIRKSILGFNQRIQNIGSGISNPMIGVKSFIAGFGSLFKRH